MPDKKQMLDQFKHGQKAAVFKCLDCEVELMVPPNMIQRVEEGYTRCNNPRCPGVKKGGGKYRRK